MRELKPRLAQRAARTAPLRYKLLGGTVAFTAYSVFVPTLALLIDPQSQRPIAFALNALVSAVLAVWGYYVATGMLARRRFLG